jgi:predicted enzyme related to lactoylglutathione lyase
VVFFDTDDVEAMRAAIVGRGGQPTAPENVNGIKRRVFEIRDPDGHAIWFGQSYHRDSPYRPTRMMRKIMPELPSDDVPTAVRHYRDVLGFSVNYEQHDIGVLDRDDVRLLVIARTPRHTGIGSAYFYVRDADALHSELVRSGADVQCAPVSQPWGLREFAVLDSDGNRLTFAQTFE